MPLLETRASGSALAYGLNSSSEQSTIFLTDTYGTLTYAYNGTGLTIPRGSWGYYQNLPDYLLGSVTNTAVNDGQLIKFTTDKPVRVYATRNNGWGSENGMSWTGWDTVFNYGSNKSYIGSNHVNNYTDMALFTKIFPSGTHTLSNTSAMYFWTNSKIAPEQPSLTPGGGFTKCVLDMNYDRNLRTFYSGTTWNDLSGNSGNATFNNLTRSSDGKGIVFNGATSSTVGSITDSANPTTLLSVDFWIKPTGDNTSSWVRLFGKDPYNGGWLIFFESASTYRQIRMLGVTNTGEQRNNYEGQLPLNTWSHVVCTWEVGNTTSGQKLYINGNLVSSAALSGSSFVTSSNPIAIGGTQSGEHFKGEIGSLRIYKQLLMTPREVAESYANGLLHKYGSTYSGRQAIVSPAVNGTTIWNFDTMGALSFSSQQADSQYIIPLNNFSVSTKIWGAGGGARLAVTDNKGGGGGYTTVPSFNFNKNACYAITVGAFGKRVPDNTNPSTNYPVGPGGGGQAAAIGYTGQGGGYSAIFAKGTNAAAVLAIAGGGGSGGVDASTNGGAGGGTTAESGFNYGGTHDGNVGTGATSTAAGINGLNNPSGSIAPGRLQGGSSGTGGDSGGGGGGGGGYWGGGAGYNGDNPPGNTGGGGGSGYIAPIYSGTTTTGSGPTPGNSSDSDRGTSGNGANITTNVNAVDGKVYIL